MTWFSKLIGFWDSFSSSETSLRVDFLGGFILVLSFLRGTRFHASGGFWALGLEAFAVLQKEPLVLGAGVLSSFGVNTRLRASGLAETP